MPSQSKRFVPATGLGTKGTHPEAGPVIVVKAEQDASSSGRTIRTSGTRGWRSTLHPFCALAMISPMSSRHKVLLEVIASSVEDARAAEAAGAGRLELVQALSEGGLTPSLGMIRAVLAATRLPVMVMLRPRGGDFCYSAAELAVLRDDLRTVKELRAAGVVLGVLNKDATVDVAMLGELVQAARPLQVTFHRAFDVTPSPESALEDLISVGVDRVLSSGQKGDAAKGADLLALLVAQAGGRIAVMPGAGITPNNAAQIAKLTRANEFHASCSHQNARDGRRQVDPEKVAGVLRALAT